MKKQKLRNLLAVGVLGISIFLGCETQKETKETGALIDKVNYLMKAEADRERKIRIDRKYNKLMKLNNKERIRWEIHRFGDYEFGDKNGDPSSIEKNKAYQAFLEKWKSERYKRNLRNKPFIEVLIEYRGY